MVRKEGDVSLDGDFKVIGPVSAPQDLAAAFHLELAAVVDAIRHYLDATRGDASPATNLLQRRN